MTSPIRVAVLGSLNLDLVARVDRLPGPGETVLASSYTEVSGGKGANQAYAAATTAPTALIGAVGTDVAGDALLAAASRHNVDTRHVTRHPSSSGRALILVAPDGENAIAVIPASADAAATINVRAALTELSPEVVLAQLELPLEVVQEAAHWTAAHQSRFVLNASPTLTGIEQLIARADPLIVNLHEGRHIAGRPGAPAHEVARALGSRCRSVVVTNGADGAEIAEAGAVEHVDPSPAQPIDTTGAGDAYAGVLAAALANGAPLRDAAHRASQAAARTVSRPRTER